MKNEYLLAYNDAFVFIQLINDTEYDVKFLNLEKSTLFNDDNVDFWQDIILQQMNIKTNKINYNLSFKIKYWFEHEAFWVLASCFMIIISLLTIMEFLIK